MIVDFIMYTNLLKWKKLHLQRNQYCLLMKSYLRALGMCPMALCPPPSARREQDIHSSKVDELATFM